MKVTGTGLFTYSQHLGPYSLQVSCSSDSSITAGAFTGIQAVHYHATGGTVQTYTFPELTTNPTDCGIESYTFTFDSETTYQAAAFTNSGITYPSATCATSPCRTFDINLGSARVSTFQIKGLIIGGAYKVSTLLSIYIGCSIQENSGTAIVPTQNTERGIASPTVKWTFEPFEVPLSGCPSTLTYQLVDSNDGTDNPQSSPTGLS